MVRVNSVFPWMVSTRYIKKHSKLTHYRKINIFPVRECNIYKVILIAGNSVAITQQSQYVLRTTQERGRITRKFKHGIRNLIKNTNEDPKRPAVILWALSINTACQTGQNGQIVELNTRHLGFGPIWSENLDNIRMRSIFARYLRNIDQIFPLIQRKEFRSDRSGH